METQNSLTSQRIGDLDCLLKKSAKKRSGNADKHTSTAVILLHGYGADASDLYPLAGILDPDETLDWFFPQAPLPLSLPWNGSGRAWFPLDERSFSALSEDQDLNRSHWNSPAVFEASRALKSLVSPLSTEYDKFFLGGFSQGSMTALDTVLECDLRPAGLCLLSSTLLKKPRWSELLQSRTVKTPYFQSHGSLDPILPFNLAVQLNACLAEAGWNGTFIEFSGGHQIPQVVLDKLSLWISDRI